MKTLGSRLRRLRERENLSQKRAAEIFGLTNTQLSRYENDVHSPDPDLLRKFADYYNVSADYLLGRTSDSKPINIEMDENENLFFFDLEGLSEEDIEAVKRHIESLRLMAKQFNEDEDKKKKN